MKYVTKQLWLYLKEHKKRYSVVLVFMVISSGMLVAPTYILRQFIDAIVEKNLTSEMLWRYSFYLVSTVILAYVTDFIWTFYLFIGSYDLQSQLREKLMAHFLKMGVPFYHRFKMGDLITRSTDDVQVMGMTVGYGLMTFLNSFLYLGFVVGMMAVTVSWQLTLLALIPMPLLAYLIFKWGSKVDALFTEAQNSVSEMNSEVLEMIGGLRVIRAFGLEETTLKKFQGKTADTQKKNDAVSELDSRFNPMINFILAFSFVMSFFGGSYLVAAQKITVGGMVSFQVYLGMVVWPMISIGDLVNVMQQGAASWRRINEVLASNDGLEKVGEEKISSFEKVNFSDFDFHYPKETRLALEKINLTVEKGKLIGVVGKTGSGKTTLLRQFGHFYPYPKEQPLLNDKKITAYETAALRQQFAEVPQEHILFSRSIKENLLFGKPKATEDELWQALKMARLDKEVEQMEEGLETLVGEKGVSLSGGQKQRLSLARAFLREAPVLLLDDALSAVDAKTEGEIIESLKQLPAKTATVLVTHRLSAIKEADGIIVLEEGKIIQRGTHQELVNTPGWYQQQYQHQQLKGGSEVV